MMRRSILHFHNLSFIRLLTFASVIGTQFHVLSVSATAPHFDDSATTAISAGEIAATSASTATTSSLLSATLSASAALTDSKTSKIMSNIGSGGSSSSTTITTTTTSSSSNSNINDGSSSSSISVTPHGTFTATTHNYAKTTSKFPLDFSISKNHWTNTADGAAVGALFPASASSSSSDAGGDVERPRTFRNKHHHERHWGPFFEEPLNGTTSGDNLLSTAHLFTEAVLNCRVGMLKDKTVMWVRRTTEKVSLLTVGNVTYSGDPRIRVKFQYPNNWRLLINPTQKEDAGIYMCQVSTHPPRVFTTNLTILEPPLRLIDDQEREVSDRYYKSGSTIDLQCQISRSFLFKEKLSILKSIQPTQFNQSNKSNTNKATAAANALVAGINELISKGNQTLKQGQFEKQFSNFIFWTKDDEPLPPTTVRRSSTTEKWLNSRISVPDAKLADSGNYSCSIGKLFRAIVQVQVLTGELPAAVQHNSALSTHRCIVVHPFLLHLTCICFIVAFKLLSRNISPSMRTDSKTLQTCLVLSYY